MCVHITKLLVFFHRTLLHSMVGQYQLMHVSAAPVWLSGQARPSIVPDTPVLPLCTVLAVTVQSAGK